MKLNFRFKNLLGTVYGGGDLIFGPEGDRVFSPVGNKVSVFNLREHKSITLSGVEGRFTYNTMALSPDGVILVAANEDGEVHVISLVSRTILHSLRTNRKVRALSFSPDGQYLAMAKESNVMVYKSPAKLGPEFNPFGLERVLKGAFDETTCISWSSCSRIVAVGSKDNTTRLYAMPKFKNFRICALGGHNEPIVQVFFEKDCLRCYTMSRNGHLLMWDPSIKQDELKEGKVKKTTKIKLPAESDDDNIEKEGDEEEESEVMNSREESPSKSKAMFYTRIGRHFLLDSLPKNAEDQPSSRTELTAADYHTGTKILVSGFSNGVFLIHELPGVELIHSLCISDQSIAAVTINPAGDWIAFGCRDHGQLLVWEWQSETYVLKQQGHFNNMACVSYSPDGLAIASGSEDGKVKLWDARTGFCYVTFSEHSGPVTSVAHASRKVVLSASIDGTVRAYDTTRYRNFRTFTSPRPAQFDSLAVDSSGDLVAAGSRDVFEIFLWAVQTGKLLEVISGHDGPVSDLMFNPSPNSSTMASVSWDGTLRVWNVLASTTESIRIGSDGTAVAFSPDGLQVAVATLNGQIGFFDPVTSNQTGSIDGRLDLTLGRSDTDLVTANKSTGYFSTLAYTPDGSCILAGGRSKVICMYHVQEMLLVRKFEVTQNRSFDAMDEVISRKKLTEFGTNLDLLETREDTANIRLPGTRKGDMSSRSHRPEVLVSKIKFSPTGRDFCASTTEGILVYSLDNESMFDPADLELNITPEKTREATSQGEHGRALTMALSLNLVPLIREVIEQVPLDEVELIVSRSLPDKYIIKLLRFVGSELETSPHVQFYSKWIYRIFQTHGIWIKRQCRDLMPTLNLLHRNLLARTKSVTEICEKNYYTIDMMLTIAKLKSIKTTATENASGGEEDQESSEEESADDELNVLQSNWVD